LLGEPATRCDHHLNALRASLDAVVHCPVSTAPRRGNVAGWLRGWRKSQLMLTVKDRYPERRLASAGCRPRDRRGRLVANTLATPRDQPVSIAADSIDDRLSEPYGVRTQSWISLTACHSNRGQAKSTLCTVPGSGLSNAPANHRSPWSTSNIISVGWNRSEG